MRKRIKNFLNEEESALQVIQADKDKDYMDLLVSDLKKESESMPPYSLWNTIVKKCLQEEANVN